MSVPMKRLHDNPYIRQLTAPQTPRLAGLPPSSYDGGVNAYNALSLVCDVDNAPSLENDCTWAPLSLSRFGSEGIVSLVNPQGTLARVQVLPAKPMSPNVRMRTFGIRPDVARYICSFYCVPQLLAAKTCGYWTYDHSDRTWVQRDIYDEAYNCRNHFGVSTTEWVLV